MCFNTSFRYYVVMCCRNGTYFAKHDVWAEAVPAVCNSANEIEDSREDLGMWEVVFIMFLIFLIVRIVIFALMTLNVRPALCKKTRNDDQASGIELVEV